MKLNVWGEYMDEEIVKRNKELVKKYPFLLIRTSWDGRVIEDEDVSYEYTWYDDIPEGWAKAFGKQMLDELLAILKEGNCLNDYQILQIKEKWGFLHWYSNGVPKSVWDKYLDWERKYEDLSEDTCIKCGEPATHVTKGWIMPVCKQCFEEIENGRK